MKQTWTIEERMTLRHLFALLAYRTKQRQRLVASLLGHPLTYSREDSHLRKLETRRIWQERIDVGAADQGAGGAIHKRAAHCIPSKETRHRRHCETPDINPPNNSVAQPTLGYTSLPNISTGIQ
jgi:hypothetical protein